MTRTFALESGSLIDNSIGTIAPMRLAGEMYRTLRFSSLDPALVRPPPAL